jgi:hypothetical protein
MERQNIRTRAGSRPDIRGGKGILRFGFLNSTACPVNPNQGIGYTSQEIYHESISHRQEMLDIAHDASRITAQTESKALEEEGKEVKEGCGWKPCCSGVDGAANSSPK